MNTRRNLAALLSSLISQLIILLSLLFPPSNSLQFSQPNHAFQESLFPLLHHLLSISDIAATLSSSKKKRKRAHSEEPRPELTIPRSPDPFKQLYLMKKSTFEWLCCLLEPLLDCRDPINSPLNLPVETRLGIGLFKLATGSDYPEISTRFRVSEPDSKFCFKQLCRVLCTNYRFWVGFPSQTELDSVSTRFETLTGLPNCCGVINCTRFEFEFDSIAAQFVVDSSSRILSVIAGFRGDKSDFEILKSSNLFKDIEKGVILNSGSSINVDGVEVEIPRYLVGDGEYSLLPWLLVPFVDPDKGSDEESFNNVCDLMRVCSLKAMASLRNWGVLRSQVKMEYKSAVACVGACSILHNMLIAREDYSAFCDELDDREVNNRYTKSCFEGDLSDEKALVIRKALATRAKM